MNLTPLSYNGGTINGGTLYAWFPRDGMSIYNLPDARPQVVDRGMGNYPKYTGKDLSARSFTVNIRQPTPTETGYREMIEDMKGLFDPQDQTARTFVLKDTANSDKQYQMSVVVTGTSEVAYPIFGVNLMADDPRMESVTTYGGTVALTASGQAGTVTVGGNTRTQPTITLTPTVAKSGGYTYKRPVLTYNTLTVGLPNYPVNITANGWNTTGLVAGGTVQADGDDVRVVVNGAEVPRWFGGGGMNSATTGVWIVLDYTPAVTLTLGGTIASSGTISLISFSNTRANATALAKIPAAGELLIDSERFVYTGKDEKAKTVTGVTRAAKGTSEASHAVGATVRWLEFDIWLMYGNSSATAPEQEDTRKPIFNLTTSTNAMWDYDEFAAGDSNYYSLPNGNRAGSWKPTVLSAYGAESQIFTGGGTAAGYGYASMANPTTDMGMMVQSYVRSGRYQADTAKLEWRWSNPAGGSVVLTTGQKYRNGASWPAISALQYSNDGVYWYSKWNEATPAASGTIVAFTNNGTATLASSYKYLRYYYYGSVVAGSTSWAWMNITDATVYLGTSVPSVTLGAEQANYYMDATIANSATGESITLKLVMAVNQVLTLDCDAHTLTLSDGTNALAALGLSSVRVEWLDLMPGVNVLTFTDTGTAAVTMVINWKDKLL